MSPRDVGLPLFTLGTANQLVRTNPGATAPEWVALSALLDAVIGSTRGTILRRGVSAWEAHTATDSAQVLGFDGNDAAFRNISAIIDALASAGTRGAILFRGASGWTARVPSTAGYVLTDAGAGADPDWAAPATGVASAWEVVERKTVVANATTLTFSGLNGDTDEAYMLVWSMKNSTSSVTDLSWRPNGVTTNQTGTRMPITSGSPSASTRTVLDLGRVGIAASNEAAGVSFFYARKVVNSVARNRHAWSDSVEFQNTAVARWFSASTWAETSTNITSIDIVASVANAIADGSRFTLYRVKP